MGSSRHTLLTVTFLTLLLISLTGCSGGFSDRTRTMRTALDAGRHDDAIAALNKELGVASAEHLPKTLLSDNALLVLDRGSIQQSAARFDLAKRDLGAADNALDVLDLAHGTSDDIGRWVFSDSAGRYVAPPHEKLLLNVLNMMNYIETGDLSGARVEARRFVVTSRYLRERDRDDNHVLALGSLLGGFAFEKSGELEEAGRFYDDAVRIDQGLAAFRTASPNDDSGEILVLIGAGRVPHRRAEHVPIGLALTRAAPYLSQGDQARATKLAAQGLVTWVSYPRLASSNAIGPTQKARVDVDGRAVHVDPMMFDVDAVVRAHWRSIEGEVMAAAVMRTIARIAAGQAIQAATGASKKASVKAAGFLTSLLVQAAMSAADVPDTRSWETLPARISLARIPVRPGAHRVALEARALKCEREVNVSARGFAAVSLLALR